MRLRLPHLTADAGRRAAWLGGATVRHNRRRAGQAQPDGLRSAPALGGLRRPQPICLLARTGHETRLRADSGPETARSLRGRAGP
jgi:hypothetical protein